MARLTELPSTQTPLGAAALALPRGSTLPWISLGIVCPPPSAGRLVSGYLQIYSIFTQGFH